MIKILFSILFAFTLLNAKYEIIENENIFTVKMEDSTFEVLYTNLKDEINYQSFTIIHEMDLAKSTKSVAEAMDKKPILKYGTNILICKSSFTLQMHEENIDNITYCPLGISVYEYQDVKYISFKKSHPFKYGDSIAEEINEKLKNIILKSLE